MSLRTAASTDIETILVVEDEIMVRVLICQYLRHCGYRVFEAADADEAIVVLREPDLSIDLVLSDTEMPGSMDGFALAHWIRQNKPGLAVILVGSPSRAVQVAGDLCESGPLLAKPYEPQTLLDQIRRAIARKGQLGRGPATPSTRLRADLLARPAR